MTYAIDVPQLYRPGVCNVWVEDSTVRAYLSELWNDPAVHILIAGGHEGVSALVRHAENNRLSQVFGIVDRDFGESNYADWGNPAKGFQRFVVPVHEIENYILDVEALTLSDINTHGKTTVEIRHRLEQWANRSVWWMACRSVIARLRRAVLDDFIPHPKNTNVVDLATAEAFITDSAWWKNSLLRRSTGITTGELALALRSSHDSFLVDLAADTWLRTFSGKELFRDVTSYIYTPLQTTSKSERDADVAKTIAKWQGENQRRPQELMELLTSMKRKAGI